MKRFRTGFAGALACAALFSAAPSSAQDVPANLRQLAPKAWLLVGQSGNVVMVPDARGVLLIDDERARDGEEMLAAARHLSPAPIRYVVNTHWHADHSGGNAIMGEAGATIIAHRNVGRRLAVDQFMAAYNRTIPASPAIAQPAIVFDQTLTVNFGDEVIQLRHTPEAHTDGDTLVYLEQSNVLHMGDVFFNGLYPFIDRSSGGGVLGLIASVDVALSIADANTIVVPAHGNVATRIELQAYRDMLQSLREQVQARIDQGDGLEAILALNLHAAYTLGGDGPRLIGAIHDSLIAETRPS